MRQRVDQLGVAEPQIQTTGGNQITAGLPNVTNTARAEKLVGSTARLYFYDWEANALTPNGKTVASQLQAQDPNAVAISQGSAGRAAPARPGPGACRSTTRSSSPPSSRCRPSSDNARTARSTTCSARPGSAACATAAKDQGKAPVAGAHCLLSGPDDNLAGSAVRRCRPGVSAGARASS